MARKPQRKRPKGVRTGEDQAKRTLDALKADAMRRKEAGRKGR